jgi:hypothetical protein
VLIDYIEYVLYVKYNYRSKEGDDRTPPFAVPGSITI